MALKQCEGCGNEISDQASSCPSCGHPQLAKMRAQTAAPVAVVRLLLFLAVFVGLMWLFFGGGLGILGQRNMADIKTKVAIDAVDQYNIAAAQGDKTAKCVQAGFVAAAYLQAEDTSKYNLWKTTQYADCTLAGLPHQ